MLMGNFSCKHGITVYFIIFKINFGIQRNIFLTEFDSIKIGDFGQSRKIDSTADVSTYEGTFHFMSPEVRAHRKSSFNTDC